MDVGKAATGILADTRLDQIHSRLDTESDPRMDRGVQVQTI